MTGRRTWDETSRPRRRFIHPRCSDCSPKTIYGLPVGHRPSAAASLPRCTWLTIGENGRRYEGEKKAREYSCRVCSSRETKDLINRSDFFRRIFLFFMVIKKISIHDNVNTRSKVWRFRFTIFEIRNIRERERILFCPRVFTRKKRKKVLRTIARN